MPEKVTLEAVAAPMPWVLSLLSMDVARAFYDMMGIEPAIHDKLHAALRGATLETRRELVQALLQKRPGPALASFCGYVEGRIGEGPTNHLSWWLQRVFAHEQETHDALFQWSWVLRRCLRQGEEGWRQLALPKQLSDELPRRFAAAVDVNEFRKRLATIQAQPLSDWDLHIYASQPYDFDDDPEGATLTDPFSMFVETVRNYQEYRFWAWILRALSPDQQTALRDKAMDFARSAELTSVKSLIQPSALDIGL
jgi:hypothetical protein